MRKNIVFDYSKAFYKTCILLIFFSCSENNKTKNSKLPQEKNNKEKVVLKFKDSIKNIESNNEILFFDELKNGEFLSIIAGPKHEKLKFFYSDTLNYIIAKRYILKNGKPKLSKIDTLKTADWTYLKIDSTSLKSEKIDKIPHFYFSTHETFMGQAIIEESVDFNLYNLENGKLHQLPFVGIPRGENDLEGNFLPNKNLDQFPEIKKILQQKAEKSPYIYHPKGKEKDINYYKNYYKKWEEDNDAFNNLANGHSGIPETIYSTYYSEALFDLDGDNENIQKIENDFYVVISEFRGDILVYDIKKEKYFPLFVESCITGCNKEISFKSNHLLEVKFTESFENETTEINLKKIIFKN